MFLVKLFMKFFMVYFNVFDNFFDVFVVLVVLCEVLLFIVVKLFVEDVRFKVCNEWVYCDFVEWMEVYYDNCFYLMEIFVINLVFVVGDEIKIFGEF